MDITQGNFTFDVRTGQVTGVVGGRQYLDPEIAGEGTKVIHSDGSTVTFNPPPVQAAIFDYSKVKSLQKYFNRTDFQFFPTWVYHPDGRSEIAKNAEECATKYGIRLLKRTDEEKAKYGGGDYRWEFHENSEWRPVPFGPKKFDPDNPDTGKIFVPKAPDPKIAQHELIAQVVQAMQGGQNDFLLKLLSAMQASGATQAMPAEPKTAILEDQLPPLGSQKSAKEHWQEVAEAEGVKIDKRWSIDKIKSAIVKARGDDASQRALAPEPADEME